MDRSIVLASDARPGTMASVVNLDLMPGTMGRRRRSLVSGTRTAQYPITYLFRHTSAAGLDTLWMPNDNGASFQLDYTDTASNTATIGLSDTVAVSDFCATSLNNKVYWAYNSDVNRLHVYDPLTSTSNLRRVGLDASGAPTVANTGAGAYAATARYYKVQWKIKSGSNVIATSELSASVSFTPSGGGTAARVTKPTTPDSATHWIVFGSLDNVTFYDISGDTVVATTTYDDSVAPSAYSTGAVAPTAGLYVPPPSARFLVSDGNRLIMGGCFEATAASGQTGTANSRVWWTQVLGALDNTGEDEAVAQTVDLKNWVDVGEDDGDNITGLSAPINGAIYVFKKRSVWALSPTGIPDAPYRADRLHGQIGTTYHRSIAIGETGDGRSCVYFISSAPTPRLHRIIGTEVVCCGQDVVTVNPASIVDTGVTDTWAVWHFTDRALDMANYRFFPELAIETPQGVRGGWVERVYPTGYTTHGAMFPADGSSTSWVLWSGGGAAGADLLAEHSGYQPDDLDTNTGMDASFRTHLVQPYGQDLRYARVGPVILEFDYGYASADNTVRIRSYAINNRTTGSITATTSATSDNNTKVTEKLETPLLGDVYEMDVTVTLDTTQATLQAYRVRLYGLHVKVMPEAEL